jgi:alpha-tubulin suppressor-like RCC1 family protein
VGAATSNTATISAFHLVHGLPAGEQVQAFACGAMHSVACTRDGKLFTWGSNMFGQLGDGGFSTSLVARQVSTSAESSVVTAAAAPTHADDEAILCVGAGLGHTVVLCRDTTALYCWGDGRRRQLGMNLRMSPVPHRVEVRFAERGARAKAVAVGHYFSLVLDGLVCCWSLVVAVMMCLVYAMR